MILPDGRIYDSLTHSLTAHALRLFIIFLFSSMINPCILVVTILDRLTIRDAAITASIKPVGTYQKSIVGTVTAIPPRFPTKGFIPIWMPTANAVRMFDTKQRFKRLTLTPTTVETLTLYLFGNLKLEYGGAAVSLGQTP